MRMTSKVVIRITRRSPFLIKQSTTIHQKCSPRQQISQLRSQRTSPNQSQRRRKRCRSQLHMMIHQVLSHPHLLRHIHSFWMSLKKNLADRNLLVSMIKTLPTKRTSRKRMRLPKKCKKCTNCLTWTKRLSTRRLLAGLTSTTLTSNSRRR